MHPSAETSRRIILINSSEAGTTSGVILPDGVYAITLLAAQAIKFKANALHQRHTASEGAKLVDRFGVLSTSSTGSANIVGNHSYSGLPASQTGITTDSILLVVGDNNPVTTAVAGSVDTDAEGVPTLTITAGGVFDAGQLRNNIGFREGDLLEVKFTVSDVEYSFVVKVAALNVNPQADIHETNDYVDLTPSVGGQTIFGSFTEIKFVANGATNCIVHLA